MRIRGGRYNKKAHLFKELDGVLVALCGREDFDTSKAVPAWANDKCCKSCQIVSTTYSQFPQPIPVYSKRVMLNA